MIDDEENHYKDMKLADPVLNQDKLYLRKKIVHKWVQRGRVAQRKIFTRKGEKHED